MIEELYALEKLLPDEEKELTVSERQELEDKLKNQAASAHKAMGDWLLTFKRLGYWSNSNEDLGCILHAYNALKNPDSQ